jgi:hypothetical protein
MTVDRRGKRSTSQRNGGRRGRGPRRRLLVGAATLLAVLSALGVAARGGGTTTVAATGRTAPLLAPVTGEATGGAVDGIGAGGEQAAFHNHAHLALYVNGRRRTIPYGIGVVPPLHLTVTADGPFVADGAAFYWLHTHDASGVIHVESPVLRRYTLGEFFDIWGEPLGRTQVGPARGRVTALVDGTPFGGDPRDIRLDRHTVLQLDVGAVVPFRPYRFPAGL